LPDKKPPKKKAALIDLYESMVRCVLEPHAHALSLSYTHTHIRTHYTHAVTPAMAPSWNRGEE
jgi:hypothetical protein